MLQFNKTELELLLRIYELCLNYEPHAFEYINMVIFHLSQYL